MATQPNRRTPRPALTRERVLQAAVELAAEGGIEALSMRKLAQALGVEAMSLYNHVANKADLVDAMVGLVVDEIELPDDQAPWDVAVRTYAVSAYETFLRHPWACSLVMSPSASSGSRAPRLRTMEWLLGRLRDAGLSPALTYHAYHALDSHILGFTLWQLGHAAGARELAGDQDFADAAAALLEELRAGYPHVAEHLGQHLAPSGVHDEHEFEFGLDLILDGLKRAHRAARGA